MTVWLRKTSISVFDVVGKIMTRIMKERLEVIASKDLPESQCGFGKVWQWSCVDTILVARHNLLRKQWNTINHCICLLYTGRRSMTLGLDKRYGRSRRSVGVPLLSLVKSFHEGMLDKSGRKLVGDCIAKARLSKVNITETQFAGDAALYTPLQQVNCKLCESGK